MHETLSAERDAGETVTETTSDGTVAAPRIDVPATQREAAFDTLTSKLSVRGMDFFYGKEQALFGNDLEIKENRVTAIIGPSGCGKSTHIRTFNRIYELYRNQRATGEIWFDGRDLLQLLAIVRVEGLQGFPDPFRHTILLQDIEVGLGCDHESGRHRDLGPGHLAEVSAFASGQGNVLFGDFLKPNDRALAH